MSFILLKKENNYENKIKEILKDYADLKIIFKSEEALEIIINDNIKGFFLDLDLENIEFLRKIRLEEEKQLTEHKICYFIVDDDKLLDTFVMLSSKKEVFFDINMQDKKIFEKIVLI